MTAQKIESILNLDGMKWPWNTKYFRASVNTDEQDTKNQTQEGCSSFMNQMQYNWIC